MRLRAEKLNRTAIEAALTETWRAAITEACSVLGIPHDRWDALPALRGTAEAVALYRLADALRVKHCCYSMERALLEAGGQLGLDPDTVSRRVREWIRASWKAA